jgi:Tol biopolymer transport system component
MNTKQVLAGVLLGAACTACSGAVAGTGTPTPAIVFTADRVPAVTGEIYRADADGTVVNLSRSPFEDTGPLVSPDGARVAFLSNRSGAAGIYVVGADSSGLQRVATPRLPAAWRDDVPQFAWAPHGETLALVSGTSYVSKLSVIGPGRQPRVLARNSGREPRWSPDGRVITVARGPRKYEVLAYRASGGLAWRTRYYGDIPGWSSRGLFAVIDHAAVRVLDERGRVRFTFRGRAAAWSPAGNLIASAANGRIEIRRSDGRIVSRTRIPGLGTRRTSLVWIDARRVVVNVYPRAIGVNTRTGRTFRSTFRYFYTPRSPDGHSLADTARRGDEFAVRVTAIEGRHSQVYTTVPGCFDDGGPFAAITSLQFVPKRKSLVYQSLCAEPFASLYAVAPDGTELTRLATKQEQEFGPSWSPDGSEIAYTRYDHVAESCKGCTGSLAVAAADGSNPRLLTHPTEPAYADYGPSWSPDGMRILFTRASFSSPGELFTIAASGGAEHDLHISGSQGTWGPTRIAWVDYQATPISLWTARPDGSDRHKVAVAGGGESFYDPAWSRDGRLAFIDGKNVVTIVSGTTRQNVQLPFDEVRSLAWSPDGTRWVVGAQGAGTASQDIYTIKTDGSDPRRLTTDLNAGGPSWR